MTLHLRCSSCRVRPLSESLNDLFREVSLLRHRIAELSHRLATLEPYLRRHGYRGDDMAEAGGGKRAQIFHGEATTLARYTPQSRMIARGDGVMRRKRVRVVRNRGAGSE